MSKLVKPICASRLADKLEANRNARLPAFAADFEKWPILEETLWFLQWLSWDRNYAGGLAKFAKWMIRTFRRFVATATLEKVGESQMSFSDCCAVHDELPVYLREDLIGDDCLVSNAFAEPRFLQNVEPSDRDAIERRAIKIMDPIRIRTLIRDYAHENLAGHLHALCIDPSFSVQNNRRLWYFQSIVECLVDAKEQWAEKTLKAVARTSVYQLVTKWFERARAVTSAVVLEGSARRGKTYASENYCRAYPHKFRFIKTPHEPSYAAMLEVLVRSIGIDEAGTSQDLRKRRPRIAAALEYSRLTYIFDEAQFLFPQTLNSNTIPQRLNLVRRMFMDTAQSVVLICTPQTLAKSSKKLRKVTGYETDQWDGRILRAPIMLPDEFSEQELADVMSKHLPEVDSMYHLYVAKLCRSVQEYRLSKLESIAKLARLLAQEDGQTVPKFSYIEAAVKLVLDDNATRGSD